MNELARPVADPGATGLGRRPMVPGLPPYSDLDAARAGEPSPWVRSLDGLWRFRLLGSPHDVGASDIGAETPTTEWDDVAVPGSWVLPADAGHDRGVPIYLNVRMPFAGQAPEVPHDNPTGVYRRTFTLPPSWRSRGTLLRVGAANSMGFVWVNGEFVGFGTDSHLASTYDITGLVRRGTNTVCIAVPRWSASTWVEDQDQWWMPGLHRSVELVSVPPIHLSDTAMVPGLDRDGATGTLDLDISVAVADRPVASSSELPPLTVEVLVEPVAPTGGAARRGRPLATTGRLDVPRWDATSDGAAHALTYAWPGHRVITALRVPGIEPWNHERPQLYRAVVVLRDVDGQVLDVRARRVGFRRVEMADRALLVNGVPVVINGVNHHDTHPDRGPATTAADSRRDLELMKRHHVNAVRTSHYPHDESFYDLCDELGLYVVDEADIESHARWRAVSDDPTYAASFLERGMRMVLRDRSHPSVIVWSLGNESGYGPSHDALAAWIRRVDPTRPLHYEGGFSLDLDSASPVSDIVCPMYASVERIVDWSRKGTDRRPLILCEYSHAMGQAGGLADYWAVFGREEGLQGGFVWEWADHGLRRTDPDGTTWLAYGGDFGEPVHDGTFVCDGLVSPDRQPHPLLEELAALTQPVTVERSGAGRLRVTNHRWFTDLGDVDAAWELTVDGRRKAKGRLELPPINPRSSADLGDPSADVGPDDGGRATLTVSFSARRRGRRSSSVWSPADATVAVSMIDLTGERRSRPAAGITVRRRTMPTSAAVIDVTVDEETGIGVAGITLGWPALSVWRAPTDNDAPPGGWRPRRTVDGWRAMGLEHLTGRLAQSSRRDHGVSRVVRYETRTGETIEHHRRVRPEPVGGVRIEERITVDRTITDLPRVGVAFDLPSAFDDLTWLGLGPGDTYPDRRRAARFATWTTTVTAQVLPFVVPQEYGLHLDTEWFELASPALVLHIAGDPPLAFSALAHSTGDLTAATHAHELPPRAATHVHIDAAHRGLGTAACGPDTHPRHLVGGGTYRFAWTLSACEARP